MPNTTPSLLIYIPTYNRYERLCEQMDLIYNHIDCYPVYVVVSNNASTDDRYKELCKKYNHEKITIINNKINLGGNPNIFNGFLHGLNYDYVWILSDDDTIVPNAIPYIMSRLDYCTDIIYLMDIKESDYKYYDQNKFLDNLNLGLGLISCVIYKVFTISSNINVGYEYFNSGFPHLSILLSACNYYGKMSVLEYPKEKVLKKKPMDPPVDRKSYVPAIYGFVTIADLIADKSRKFEFICGYINRDYNMWSVVEFKQKYPERFRNMGGYILTQSVILYIDFIIVYYAMSIAQYIWNKLSIQNKKRLKTLITGV